MVFRTSPQNNPCGYHWRHNPCGYHPTCNSQGYHSKWQPSANNGARDDSEDEEGEAEETGIEDSAEADGNDPILR